MGACDLPLMNTVCGAVGGVASETGEAITDGIGAWIAKSMGDVAQSAADLAAKAVDKTTAVDLNATWFRDNYELILPIGLVLTVGTFCLQLTRAAWRRDERALAQAAFGTMVGVLFAFAAIACTTVALTVVDALSAGLFQAANSSVDDAIRRVIKVDNLGATYGLGWGVSAIVALGWAIGAFSYWAVMIARKVGILVLVTLAVFAGAGGGWEVAKRWRRGWIEATATLIVSKLLMTIVFLLGVSAMGKSDSDGGMAALSDAVSGIVVMVLVLLCPYATYKFVHWAADGGGHDDLHRSGVAGVGTAAGAAKTAGQLAMQAKMGGMAPQGPSKVPGQGAGGIASGIDPSGGSGSGGAGQAEADPLPLRREPRRWRRQGPRAHPPPPRPTAPRASSSSAAPVRNPVHAPAAVARAPRTVRQGRCVGRLRRADHPRRAGRPRRAVPHRSGGSTPAHPENPVPRALA